MTVEQLRQRVEAVVERMESQGDTRAASFTEAVTVNATTLLALLDIAEAAQRIEVHDLGDEGVAVLGLVALNDALARLDTEGQR